MKTDNLENVPVPVVYDEGRTDTANKTRFLNEFGNDLLYVPPWKKWLSWSGSRWIDDNGVGTFQRAERYAKSLWEPMQEYAAMLDREELAKVISFLKSSNQSPKIKSFLELASFDERVVCPVDELNADPTLLNCVNGTIDLLTGTLRPHSPADRITQISNVAFDPNAGCPKWVETLGHIFDGDQAIIAYVQRLLGYSISGETGEHILPIAYGRGCNGKSTIWNVVADLLGDYATLANDELLMGDKGGHPTEKASLYQKRFVAISEPEKNSKLKESRVKELTGDRLITARRMHEDFWSFHRTHTFWISSNHLPRIDGTDEGIWRRVKLIPFSVDLRTKVEPIPDFDKWLVKHEGRGILAWLVRGFLDYRQNGLQEPEGVKLATSNYRADSDSLGEFLKEYVVEEAGSEVLASELFRVYTEIHKGKWSQTVFGKTLAEKFTKTKSQRAPNRGKTIYQGIRIRTAKDDENGDVLPVATSLDIGPKNCGLSREQHPNRSQLVADDNSNPDVADEGVLF